MSPGSQHEGSDYINASWLTGRCLTVGERVCERGEREAKRKRKREREREREREGEREREEKDEYRYLIG